jgi:hypothetical protein
MPAAPEDWAEALIDNSARALIAIALAIVLLLLFINLFF